MIRLAIADDHQSLLDGIELLLKFDSEISIIGSAIDGEGLWQLIKKQQPDIVLTDIRMPKIDGIALTQKIKDTYPEIKVIAFSMFDQPEAVNAMIEAGASGYLLKNSSLQEVIKAVRIVSEGEKYFDANLSINTSIEDSKHDQKSKLTERQKEILRLVGQGKTSREIAEELFIGVLTVETHRKNMMRILGLKGKGELLRYALDKKYRF